VKTIDQLIADMRALRDSDPAMYEAIGAWLYRTISARKARRS